MIPDPESPPVSRHSEVTVYDGVRLLLEQPVDAPIVQVPDGHASHGCLTFMIRCLTLSVLQLQAVQLPSLRPSDDALQHRRVRQRLHAGPKSSARVQRRGQGLHQRPELRLGAAAAAAHPSEPVPVCGGEL